mgnify:CR=1 FL=1
MMKKYKVEIKETNTYVVDVEARNKDEARGMAEEKWKGIAESGTHHYHQQGDKEMMT